MGTRPLPCTLNLCHSRATGELIRLSARLSLDFGVTVGLRVDLPVIVGCLKLIHLSERLSNLSRRLSCRLLWSSAQSGGSDANKHARKAGYFHAAGELIRLSARVSWHFGSSVDSPVVGCLKLIHLSVCVVHCCVACRATCDARTCALSVWGSCKASAPKSTPFSAQKLNSPKRMTHL